jgi:hypothetical protein
MVNLKLSSLFPELSRTKSILSEEGLPVLIKRAFAYAGNALFGCGTYLVYEFKLDRAQIVDKIPRTGCSFKTITTMSEYNEMVGQGYDFGIRDFRPRLRKGAIVFCAFINKQLASEYWVAQDARAKKAVDPIPFKVDFAHGEVCSGVRFTDPKYRRYGLSEYLFSERIRYLVENNYHTSKATVNVNNVISQQMNAKLSGKIIAKGRYLHIFAWHFWKEKAMGP